MNVELNPMDKILTGETNVTYINNEDVELNEIYFHIYPNAYKREETAPILAEDITSAYPNGFKPGNIDIATVTLDGKDASYSIEGSGETILKLTLEKPLKQKEHTQIKIGFKIALPNVDDRLGYGDNCFNFGSWYPIAAVYDETGWNLDPYYPMGDPFYSDISDYKVKITVPKQFVVAGTGEITEEKIQGDKKSYVFQESSVRDFAWVSSDKFKVDTQEVDGVKIKNYYLDGDKDRNAMAMTAAKNSVKIFNRIFGKYPYKTYSVVATHFITGMEYPGIVFINKDYYYNNTDEFYLEVTIAHETAHQWWYNTVGNDEVDEAWLDESMAAYSEVIYYENTLDRKQAESYMLHDYLEVYNGYRDKIVGGEVILKPVSEFDNLNDYAVLVYYKGAIMLDAIRTEVGDEIFFKIMTTYYDRYKLKHAKTEDFINVVEEVTGRQWDDFFDKWLMGK
jgi:hypothetical protein